MKNIISITMLVIGILTLIGCNEKSCNPRQFSPKETPALVDGYNTCEAIVKNFSYNRCQGENELLYKSHEGDTIRICGYIYEYWDGGNDFLLFDNPDNGTNHRYGVSISYRLPDSVDISKRCFITGRLGFNLLTLGGGYLEPWQPWGSMAPVINNVQDIYFE